MNNLEDEALFGALENWAKGGKHTTEDLLMHLGKMMS